MRRRLMVALAGLAAALVLLPTAAFAETYTVTLADQTGVAGLVDTTNVAVGDRHYFGGESVEVEAGTTVRLNGSVDDGYLFLGWSGVPDGTDYVDMRNTSFVMPAQDVTISARVAAIDPGMREVDGMLVWDEVAGFLSCPEVGDSTAAIAQQGIAAVDGAYSFDIESVYQRLEQNWIAMGRPGWGAGLTGDHQINVVYYKRGSNGQLLVQGRLNGAFTYHYQEGLLTQLEKPAGAAWEDGTSGPVATWDAVEGASRYKVVFYETTDGDRRNCGTMTVATTSCPLSDVLADAPTGTSYAFTVEAQGPDGDYQCIPSGPCQQSESWTGYDVWVAGVRASNLNADDVLGDGTVAYDAETSTLALDGADIAASDLEAAVYAKQDLTIELEGESAVTLTLTDAYAGGRKVAAIACEGGSLTIRDGAGAGQGSLVATCDAEDVPTQRPTTSEEECCVSGISATGAISVEGVELTAESLVAWDGYASSYGMRCRGFENVGVTLRDSTVTATSADTQGACSIAIECEGENVALAGRSVLVEGGELMATAGFSAWTSVGIDAAGDVVVEGAKVTAEGGESRESAGILSWIGDVSLNGEVTARGSRTKGAPEDAWSAGVRADEGSVSMAGGTVGATSGWITEDGDAHGIFGANGVSITGGTVTASGPTTNMDGCDSDHSAAIASSRGDVVISGTDTKVSAHGGYSGGDAFGIEAANGDVAITGATVRASATYSGTDGAVGVRAGGESADAGNIVIRGADVAAAGEARAVSLTGSLTVAPDEGMLAAVRTHDEVLEDDWSTPDPDWDGMVAASTAIEGSPFAGETTVDPALLDGTRYLSVNDEQVEEPDEPVDPSDPSAPTGTDGQESLPQTGDDAASPLAALACGATLAAAGIARRRMARR